jgi:hypothetical protein
VAENRLLSRLLCAEAGISHPPTLAVVPVFKTEYDLFSLDRDLQRCPATLKVVFLSSHDAQLSILDENVRDFILSVQEQAIFDEVGTIVSVCW